MDTKQMRETLATRAMGWVWNEFEGLEMWGILSHGGIKLECWLDDWEPDKNGKQMMDVIEKMREKGWRCVVNDALYPTITAVWWRKDNIFCQFDAKGESECEARMLAAARALGMEDSNG